MEATKIDRPLKPLVPEPAEVDPRALGLWLLRLEPILTRRDNDPAEDGSWTPPRQ